MSLMKSKAAPFILIEDHNTCNTIPLLLELTEYDESALVCCCYEQPICLWKSVFRNKRNCLFYEEFTYDIYKYTNENCIIFIDSLNQMSLSLTWKICLQSIQKLNKSTNVKLIAVIHKDTLVPSSRLRTNLSHLANAIISYESNDKISILLKKGSKISRDDAIILYDDKTNNLSIKPIIKEDKTVQEEPEPILPQNLSTFKIEMEQIDKMEKYKLKLPYMSKINEGEGKVYYEPDAVDDWDEEDPDEDLDI